MFPKLLLLTASGDYDGPGWKPLIRPQNVNFLHYGGPLTNKNERKEGVN